MHTHVDGNDVPVHSGMAAGIALQTPMKKWHEDGFEIPGCFSGGGILFLFRLFCCKFFVGNSGRKFMAADRDSFSSLASIVELPPVEVGKGMALGEAIARRRSVRVYSSEAVELWEVSRLLWAAQGITQSAEGLRSVPSAGALYPLEVFLVAGNVRHLPIGVYRYRPQTHQLLGVHQRDVQSELSLAALGQHWVADAALVLIIAADFQRTTAKYGQRGIRYVLMEVGHAAQNVYLECTSLGLGTVLVGAFYDDQVQAILQLPPQEEPLAVLPIGRL